jgi:hypothetical protein
VHRYTKQVAGQKATDLAAAISLAVFDHRGEARHFGDLDLASAGCVHVHDFTELTQLNYHSVKG